jgi:hypothetical protein
MISMLVKTGTTKEPVFLLPQVNPAVLGGGADVD